jgi:hypothetical protein
MASVTPVNAGASDLFKSGTTGTPLSSAAPSPNAQTAPESEPANDSVQLSLQALQLIETNRLFNAGSASQRAVETNSALTGPITLAPQPELAAALEQAYGLSAAEARRPVIRPRRPAVNKPKGKPSREPNR